MIKQACEKVYEAITGKCWHRSCNNHLWLCSKCNEVRSLYMDIGQRNPPLATSLDAWREYIWPRMNKYQSDFYDAWLTSEVGGLWAFKATPMHHLEAALRMLGEDELAEKVSKSCKK